MAMCAAFDYAAIKNVIARYCEALDTKAFDMLEKVFLSSVTADYPFNRDMKGVHSISTAIQERLGPIRTHHNLTTQSITIGENGKSAHAETYFQGVHFGQGPHEGKMLCAYGKYIDELVMIEAKDDDVEGVRGASGIWRIGHRKVVFTQRIGDENIMKEYLNI
ncbi:hypothetical protein ACN47E_002376 [Coniothyrium glycines]